MQKEPIGGCGVCGFVFYELAEICECYPKQTMTPKTVSVVNLLTVANPWPLFIVGLSWLRTKEDKGIGDTVKHALTYMGGSQFEWVMQRLGIDCGCGSRQEWLNAAYPYSPVDSAQKKHSSNVE